MQDLELNKENIIISPFSKDYNKAVVFWGENNCVCFAGKLSGNIIPRIRIGQKPGAFVRSPHGCLVYIVEGVSFQANTTIFLAENYSFVYIGRHSMISWNVEMWCTDSHSVLDLDLNLVNKGKYIYIGNHCWIGRDVSINKNSIISDDSIVGCNSLVAKKFKESRCAIGGNPAKIIKTNVSWDAQPPDLYLQNRKPLTNKSKSLLSDNEKNIIEKKAFEIKKFHKDTNVDWCIDSLLTNL